MPPIYINCVCQGTGKCTNRMVALALIQLYCVLCLVNGTSIYQSQAAIKNKKKLFTNSVQYCWRSNRTPKCEDFKQGEYQKVMFLPKE